MSLSQQIAMALLLSELFRKILQAALFQDATAVRLEERVRVEVEEDRPPDTQFLHHILLAHPTVEVIPHVVSVRDAGHFFASRVGRAALWLEAPGVLGPAGGLNRAVLLQVETVKETPTTVAALVQVIAVHAILDG